jgi:hypothetical protein
MYGTGIYNKKTTNFRHKLSTQFELFCYIRPISTSDLPRDLYEVAIASYGCLEFKKKMLGRRNYLYAYKFVIYCWFYKGLTKLGAGALILSP